MTLDLDRRSLGRTWQGCRRKFGLKSTSFRLNSLPVDQKTRGRLASKPHFHLLRLSGHFREVREGPLDVAVIYGGSPPAPRSPFGLICAGWQVSSCSQAG